MYQTIRPLTNITQLYFIPDSDDIMIHRINVLGDHAFVEKCNIHSKNIFLLVIPFTDHSNLGHELKNCAHQSTD